MPGVWWWLSELKSEVWPICQCLMLGHETKVYAVYVSISYWFVSAPRFVQWNVFLALNFICICFSSDAHAFIFEIIPHNDLFVFGNWKFIIFKASDPAVNRKGNDCAVTEYIFKCIILIKGFCCLVQIPIKFVPKGPLHHDSSMVQLMAWRRIDTLFESQ